MSILLNRLILIIVCVFMTFSGFAQDSTSVKQLLDEAYSFESTNPKKALKIYRNAYKLSKNINYPIGAFKATMYSGIVKSDMAEYDSALFYYKKAIPLSELSNSVRSKAITYLNIGNVFQFKGLLDSVPSYYIKAATHFELINDSLGISNTYINLAALFETLNQTEKQIEYIKTAIKTIPNDHIELLGLSYGNIGTAYLDKKDSKSALTYFTRSDSISKTGDYLRLNFFNYRNFGEYYFYEKDFQKAIQFYQNAIKAGQNFNDEYYKNDILLNLGLAYYELEDFHNANRYLQKAMTMGKSTNSIQIQRDASLNLFRIYQSDGDFQKALNYHKTYTKLRDSLVDINKSNRINELEIKYQSEKKDKELTKQQLELEKQESQTKLMTGFAIALLLTSILIWFLYQQRQKRKNQEIITLKREQQVKTLETLMEGEEKERLRIAKELHDGVNVDLSSIKYKLTSLLEKNNKIINEAVEMIDKSCEQVRAISHDLIPPSLSDFSLVDAIKDFCATKNSLHNAKISCQTIGEDIPIAKKAEVNIFRIIQELVNNSIKHAAANEIDVQVSFMNDHIQVTVEDDGIGFDRDNNENSGIGLKNIESRITYLNAKIDFTSDSKGTSYVIDINTDALT